MEHRAAESITLPQDHAYIHVHANEMLVIAGSASSVIVTCDLTLLKIIGVMALAQIGEF